LLITTPDQTGQAALVWLLLTDSCHVITDIAFG